MRDEIANDPVLRLFVESLEAMPERNPALVARVLAATAVPAPRPWWQRFRLPLVALVTAAAAVVIVTRQPAGDAPALAARPTSDAPVPDASRALPEASTRAVAADGALPATVPVQFTFDAPTASQVHLVGDFNAWDADAAPLTRLGDGMWAVTLDLSPGRHVYAFVVDGRTWVADPRAPRAPDSDFSQPGSVLLVQAP